MSEDSKTANGLERRIPQASEAARLDRRLSWSGRLAPAEPAGDLDLLERLYTRLRDR